MSKVDIKRLDSVTKNDTTATEQINDNFQALQQAIENTVSRDGTVPNYMDADLDLNSYKIINAGDPVNKHDVVTLKYFEEKAGGAVEAAAEAKASASRAASSAQSALVASNNAIGQVAKAESLLLSAEGQLAETQQYVDAAKADIDATVEAGKQEVNTTIDEAQMNLSDTISQAVEDVKAEAVAAAEGAIQGAADAAIQIATDHADTIIKPELQTYVDSSNANATIASNSANAAMEYANSASTSATKSESAALRAEEAAQQPGRVIQLGFDGAMQNGVLVFTHTPSGVEVPYTLLDEHEYELDLSYTGADLSSLTKMYVKNGDDTIRFVSALHRDATTNATVADMDAVMRFNSSTGYRWLFKAAYKVTPSGAKVFLLYPVVAKEDTTKITNCITEIPQDIKLELNNGVLTLKAGSKVYIPNGAGKFDEVVTASDRSITWPTSEKQQFFVFVTANGVSLTNYRVAVVVSGASDSLSGTTYHTWYDTTSNIINGYQTDVVNPGLKLSLPVCLITMDTTGVTSIDQVFNGFGRIGSTFFALPGVKGLIPNGRNVDGSLKNAEFTVSKVSTVQAGSTSAGYIGFVNGTLMRRYSGNSVYDESKNIWYNPETGNSFQFLYCGDFSETSAKITSLTPKLPFRAADDQEVAKLNKDNTFTKTNTFVAPIISNSFNNAIIKAISPTLRENIPTSPNYTGVWLEDQNGKKISLMDMQQGASGENYIRLLVYSPDGNTVTRLGLYAEDGTSRTDVGTPPSSDNSTQIATTAWCKRYVQEVSARPANPDANIFYCVPEG